MDGVELDHRIDPYILYIQQCYKSWPASKFYIKQLERYLCSRKPGDVQTPKLFEIHPEKDQPYFQPVELECDSRISKLALVEGLPSPKCLTRLGGRFYPRPELLLGHLEIERVDIQDRTSYELPTLPSRRDNIHHVKFITLARTRDPHPSAAASTGERARADQQCLLHEKRLLDNGRSGYTRIRKVNVHNTRYFSIEQTVSFTIISRTGNNWTGLLLLDQGMASSEEKLLPWTDGSRYSQHPEFLPTVRYNEHPSPAALELNQADVDSDNTYVVQPFHPLKESFTPHELELLAANPYFIVSRIYSAAALSWSMVLNFLDDEINQHQEATAGQSRDTLAQLRYNIGLVQRFHGSISSSQSMLSQHVAVSTTRDQDASATEVDQILVQLLADFDHLLQRCQNLLRRCEAITGMLQSSISILEAQKSIQQSQEIARLTTVALVFIPLSFCATVFGMNVQEITKGDQPSLWVYFIVSLCTTTATFFGIFISSVKQWIRQKFFAQSS